MAISIAVLIHCYGYLSITICLLFLYDKENILAYSCHMEEHMNFQSFSHKNKPEEKRESLKRNMQLQHCHALLAHAYILYSHTYLLLLVVARCVLRAACVQWLFAMCACY